MKRILDEFETFQTGDGILWGYTTLGQSGLSSL